MNKCFILLFLLLGCCGNPHDTIRKECIESHNELKPHTVMVGKMFTTQLRSETVCDKRDFIYYDETGIAWRIEITKKSIWHNR